MHKFIRYILPIALLATVFSSCEDYLDINDDPNRVTEVNLSSLLPPIQERLASTHYSISFTTMQATQQLGSYFGYFEQFSLDGAWSNLYLRVLENARLLAEQADEANSPHYEGIAKVIQAYSLSLLTDSWEAAPWSEAFKGAEDLQPSFDEQEFLYGEANRLLDEAITLLGAGESVFSPDDDDLMYGGDISAWTKAAYAIKARLAIHLLNKGGNYAQQALDAAANAFESNGDDMQFVYNSVIRNPWHTSVALANNTGNFTVAHGSYFIELLNGELYPVEDPRLPLLADKDDNDEYIGIKSYDNDAPANTVDFSVNTWHSTEQAPILMSTYAEMKFIEAEAHLAKGDNGPAYQAYLDGIAASMDKYGVDEAERDAYLAGPAVAVGEGNLSVELVMKEKYIALYLNPEVWTDMRRYNFSSDVYKGFEIPDPIRWGGPAQRALYPADELNRNGAEVAKVTRPFEQQMWRDQ